MECPCCMDPITKETGKTTLSCGHSFHFKCTVQWFHAQIDKEISESCPCCRNKCGDLDGMPFTADEEEEDEDVIEFDHQRLNELLEVEVSDFVWDEYRSENTCFLTITDINDVAILSNGKSITQEQFDSMKDEVYVNRVYSEYPPLQITRDELV